MLHPVPDVVDVALDQGYYEVLSPRLCSRARINRDHSGRDLVDFMSVDSGLASCGRAAITDRWKGSA